jgi:hypothetical protein
MSKWLMLSCMHFGGSLISIIDFQYFKLISNLFEAMFTLDYRGIIKR